MRRPHTPAAAARRGRRLALFAVAALLALALAGCGKANTMNVDFKGLVLHPQTIVVPAGTTITWTNHDPEPHTVTSSNDKVPDTSFMSSPQPGAFNSGPIEPGGSYSFTFDTPGTYKYADLIDGYITGTVIVR